MAATYDPTLPTDADHVRFLVGDTDTTDALFQDEEIAAVLAEEAVTASGQSLKYFAAASLLSMLWARWSAAGQGISAKTVGRLHIEYGNQASVLSALEDRISFLRRRGAFLLMPRPKVFRVL